MGQQRALIEVDRRLGDGAGDVRVRGEVDDGVVAVERRDQILELARVGLDDVQPRVGEVLGEVPFPSGGEVVVDRDSFGGRIAQ